MTNGCDVPGCSNPARWYHVYGDLTYEEIRYACDEHCCSEGCKEIT